MSEQGSQRSVIELPATGYSRNEDRNLPAVQAEPMALVASAIQRGMAPEIINKLIDVADRFEANEARRAYNVAFAAFKAEAVAVLKNKYVTDGPLRGKSYAELHSVVDAVTPALSRHGLSASWSVTKDEKDWMEVTCVLKHIKGHSESVRLGGPPDVGGAKSAMQARASTLTYLERYTLKAVCGVAERGDDSDAGGGKKDGVEPDAEGKALLEKCASLDGLQATWKALTAQQRKSLGGVKDDMKAKIEAADREASK